MRLVVSTYNLPHCKMNFVITRLPIIKLWAVICPIVHVDIIDNDNTQEGISKYNSRCSQIYKILLKILRRYEAYHCFFLLPAFHSTMWAIKVIYFDETINTCIAIRFQLNANVKNLVYLRLWHGLVLDPLFCAIQKLWHMPYIRY